MYDKGKLTTDRKKPLEIPLKSWERGREITDQYSSILILLVSINLYRHKIF